MVLDLSQPRPILPLPVRSDPARPQAIQLKLSEEVLALVLQRVQGGSDSGMRITLGPNPVSPRRLWNTSYLPLIVRDE